MITAIAKVIAKPGMEYLMNEVLLTLAKETQENEQGCLRYKLYVSSENASEIMVVGQYINEEAIEAHRQSPHFQLVREKLPDFVQEKDTDILDGELLIHIYKQLDEATV